MMRRTPMARGTSTLARTPMKRAQPVGAVRPERIKPVAAPLARPVRYAEPANDAVIAKPKRVYIRSRKLLDAVKTLPCMHTGKVGETDPAHSNHGRHGKGKGIKADDNRVAALCRDVHRDIDQGSKLSQEERDRIWWDAHVKTVRTLLARGLWPADVPVPDLEENA